MISFIRSRLSIALVAMSVLSLSSTVRADSPPDQTLTQSIKDSVAKEVAAQVHDAIAPVVKDALTAAKTQATTPKADAQIAAQAADVKAPDKPSAGTRIANVGADVLETLASKAKSYGGKIEDGLSKAVDYGMQETPIVLHEFLVWRAWRHGIYVVIPSIATLAALIASVVLIKLANANRWNDEGLCIVTVIWSAATLVIGGAIAWNIIVPNLLSFIQIIVAPRIYLIEELAKLMGH